VRHRVPSGFTWHLSPEREAAWFSGTASFFRDNFLFQGQLPFLGTASFFRDNFLFQGQLSFLGAASFSGTTSFF